MVNTREIAEEYRLSHWAQIMQERAESGLSIKAYCRQLGIGSNTYFYWQRKLREAACHGLAVSPQLEAGKAEKSLVPVGWTQVSEAEEPKDTTLPVEIGSCRVLVSDKTDPALLARVCRVLTSLC